MNSPKAAIDKMRMTRLQYIVVLICLLVNLLDGTDVLVITYAAPAIANTWQIGPEALGIVFSAGLVGMTLGTFVLAPFADRIGRKPLMIASATLMGVCVYLTSYATDVTSLIAYRFVSGLGIGCILAGAAALTAEYTPNSTRDFWVSFVTAGYPIGAVISGLVSASVIPTSGWESMFRLAGIASLSSVPIMIVFLPESIDFYLKFQPKNALSKVNKILNKLKLQLMNELPPVPEVKRNIPIKDLMSTAYRIPTFQLWVALFMAFSTVYFLISWIPKLASDAGLSVELAIYAGTVFNGGAVLGILTQGYFSSRFGLKKTISVIFILSAVLMSLFKFFIGSDLLLVVFFLLGFGVQGGFVGLYAVAARMYPTEFRATGVGWAMGTGRLGGIAGPALGGVLVGAGLSMSANFLVFTIPTLLAGIMTMRISSKEIR